MPNKPTRPSRTSNAVPQITVARPTTTSAADTNPKTILVDTKALRRAQNEELLKNTNIRAFLGTVAWSEGGGYDFKYGATAGKKNDSWRFSDYSTHPGIGKGGHSSAAGMYQITKKTWQDHGVNSMGLIDFSPHTQDLIAVNILRRLNAIDSIVAGDFKTTMSKASGPWASLSQGPGQANRYEQPYKPYEATLQKYREFGGVAP